MFMGNLVYANFNLTLVDDAEIRIGSHCMFGPNVTIATAGHPVEPGLRRQAIQFNMPVHLGENGSGQGQSSCPEYPLAMTRSLVREALSQRTYRPM